MDSTHEVSSSGAKTRKNEYEKKVEDFLLRTALAGQKASAAPYERSRSSLSPSRGRSRASRHCRASPYTPHHRRERRALSRSPQDFRLTKSEAYRSRYQPGYEPHVASARKQPEYNGGHDSYYRATDPMMHGHQEDPRLVEWHRQYEDWYERVGRFYNAPRASEVAAGAVPRGWAAPATGVVVQVGHGGYTQPPHYHAGDHLQEKSAVTTCKPDCPTVPLHKSQRRRGGFRRDAALRAEHKEENRPVTRYNPDCPSAPLHMSERTRGGFRRDTALMTEGKEERVVREDDSTRKTSKMPGKEAHNTTTIMKDKKKKSPRKIRLDNEHRPLPLYESSSRKDNEHRELSHTEEQLSECESSPKMNMDMWELSLPDEASFEPDYMEDSLDESSSGSL